MPCVYHDVHSGPRGRASPVQELHRHRVVQLPICRGHANPADQGDETETDPQFGQVHSWLTSILVPQPIGCPKTAFGCPTPTDPSPAACRRRGNEEAEARVPRSSGNALPERLRRTAERSPCIEGLRRPSDDGSPPGEQRRRKWVGCSSFDARPRFERMTRPRGGVARRLRNPRKSEMKPPGQVRCLRDRPERFSATLRRGPGEQMVNGGMDPIADLEAHAPVGTDHPLRASGRRSSSQGFRRYQTRVSSNVSPTPIASAIGP